MNTTVLQGARGFPHHRQQEGERSHPLASAARSFQQPLSQANRRSCFFFFFSFSLPLYSQLLCTHDALIAVLLPRGIPDRVIFSGAGKFPFLEEVPKLSAVILWKRQKTRVDTDMLTEGRMSHKSTKDYPPSELRFKCCSVSLRCNSGENHSLADASS